MSDGTNQPDPGLGAEASSNGSYRVLARKYRPATFDDLIGQDASMRDDAFRSRIGLAS